MGWGGSRVYWVCVWGGGDGLAGCFCCLLQRTLGAVIPVAVFPVAAKHCCSRPGSSRCTGAARAPHLSAFTVASRAGNYSPGAITFSPSGTIHDLPGAPVTHQAPMMTPSSSKPLT